MISKSEPSCSSIQGAMIQRQRPQASSLGTNDRVCSWIDVTVCSRLTTVPTTSAVMTIGDATVRPVERQSLMIS
jgi:hypothetical protein